MNLNRGRLRVRWGASVIAWMGSLDVVNWQFWHKGLFVGQLSVLDFDVGRIIEDILVTVPIHVVRVTRTAFDRTGQCQLTASLDMEVSRSVQISPRIWKNEKERCFDAIGRQQLKLDQLKILARKQFSAFHRYMFHFSSMPWTPT